MLALCLSLAVVGSPDNDAAARRSFAAAVAAYGGGRYDEARARLDEAESVDPSDKLLALILRQRGLVEDAVEQRGPAAAAFMYAVELNDELELSPREHRADTVRLFACARRLLAAGWTRSRAATSEAFNNVNWRCPEEPAKLVVAPPPPSAKETSSSATTWVLVALGIVAAAGIATAVAVAASGSDPYAGTTGVRIEL